MAYDPTLPANNSPIVSAELRNQFNALKALIDAQAALIADLQSQLANKAFLPTMQAYDQSISDPPTQTDIQNLVDWLNQVLGQLEGTP
jgi:hypothetical protein